MLNVMTKYCHHFVISKLPWLRLWKINAAFYTCNNHLICFVFTYSHFFILFLFFLADFKFNLLITCFILWQCFCFIFHFLLLCVYCVLYIYCKNCSYLFSLLFCLYFGTYGIYEKQNECHTEKYAIEEIQFRTSHKVKRALNSC